MNERLTILKNTFANTKVVKTIERVVASSLPFLPLRYREFPCHTELGFFPV